jgi:hypothetical protein
MRRHRERRRQRLRCLTIELRDAAIRRHITDDEIEASARGARRQSAEIRRKLGL